MTNEHLRPLLDNHPDLHLFFRVSELLARGELPECVVAVMRRGTMTALQKPGGGVGASFCETLLWSSFSILVGGRVGQRT